MLLMGKGRGKRKNPSETWSISGGRLYKLYMFEMNRKCFRELFGGIALPGKKLGCLVLEISDRISFFIIFYRVFIKCQRIDGIEVCLYGRVLRLVVCDDLLRGHSIVESRASTRKS